MNNKTGSFLAELRKEKNLTQYELACMIPISREAVSKWERGLNKPSESTLNILAEIFEVKPIEILEGRRLSLSEASDVAISLYSQNHKRARIIKILVLSLILLVSIFLVFYFINNYNSIHVYSINSEGDIIINDGLILTTKDKVYFQLGNIDTSQEIKGLMLYMSDSDDEESLIYYTEDDNIIFYDYYGYNNYLDVDNIDNIINNLYLHIYLEEEIKTVKLTVKEDFANTSFLNLKKQSISQDSNTISVIDSVDPTKIKETFDLTDDEVYTYTMDSYDFTFFADANLLVIIENISKAEIKEWYYYLDNNYIVYNYYLDDELANTFEIDNGIIMCQSSNCLEAKIEYNKIASTIYFLID